MLLSRWCSSRWWFRDPGSPKLCCRLSPFQCVCVHMCAHYCSHSIGWSSNSHTLSAGKAEKYVLDVTSLEGKERDLLMVVYVSDFSHFTCNRLPGSLLKPRVSDSAGLGWGSRFSIANKTPGNVVTAGLVITLWIALVLTFLRLHLIHAVHENQKYLY